MCGKDWVSGTDRLVTKDNKAILKPLKSDITPCLFNFHGTGSSVLS